MVKRLPSNVPVDSRNPRKGLLAAGFSQIDDLLSSTPSSAGKPVPAPSEPATRRAKQAYRLFASEGLLPDRIVASGEGGVALCFLRGDKLGDVEFLNSGENLASIEDRASGATEIWEFTASELKHTQIRIREFLDRHANNPV
jgi:hypothetical protein